MSSACIVRARTQLQYRSFYIMDRTRMAAKCAKMKKSHADCAKQPFF